MEMLPIRADEVVSHLSNSIEGYTDEYGFYWSVQGVGESLKVFVYHDDKIVSAWRLDPVEVKHGV